METKNSNIRVNSEGLLNTSYKIDKINKRLENIFNNVDDIINNINNNDNWKGNTNDEYYNRYLELQKYYPKIIKGIEAYSNFLKVTAENYKNAENQINTNIESNLDNLNIN